jgi:hypothetical protein
MEDLSCSQIAAIPTAYPSGINNPATTPPGWQLFNHRERLKEKEK